MYGVAGRIRGVLSTDLPALQKAIDEAECLIRDLESGIEATPVDPDRVLTPEGAAAARVSNRAPLSPVPPPPRRHWDTRQLREAWDPVRDALLDHTDREIRVIYPLALKILEGRMDLRRALSTPIVQMIAEHEEIRAKLPALRAVAVNYDPVVKATNRVPHLFERFTRVEEIELFPALLQLADGNFDVTATPLMARYQTGNSVTRSLRRSKPPKAAKRPSLLERLRALVEGD